MKKKAVVCRLNTTQQAYFTESIRQTTPPAFRTPWSIFYRGRFSEEGLKLQLPRSMISAIMLPVRRFMERPSEGRTLCAWPNLSGSIVVRVGEIPCQVSIKPNVL